MTNRAERMYRINGGFIVVRAEHKQGFFFNVYIVKADSRKKAEYAMNNNNNVCKTHLCSARSGLATEPTLEQVLNTIYKTYDSHLRMLQSKQLANNRFTKEAYDMFCKYYQMVLATPELIA